MVDKLKLIVAALLVMTGIAGYYLLADSATVVRVLAVLAGLVAGAVVGGLSEPGRQFIAFAREAKKEAEKVVWPTRKETFQTTGAVFAFVVVIGVFLWMVDAGLFWFVRLLMGRSDS